MNNKEEKKGFWASLFAAKPCSCCCGNEIEEVKENKLQQQDVENDKENKNRNSSTCDCGKNY